MIGINMQTIKWQIFIILRRSKISKNERKIQIIWDVILFYIFYFHIAPVNIQKKSFEIVTI